MGRKSLAQMIYAELEENEEKTEPEIGQWVVLYDFPKMKPSTKFWTNLHRLQSITGVGGLVQYSAFVTTDKKNAISVVKLVHHYDGEVKFYKIEEELAPDLVL